MSEGWFTIAWRDDAVVMLDQRELPEAERYLELHDVEVAVAGQPAAPGRGMTAEDLAGLADRLRGHLLLSRARGRRGNAGRDLQLGRRRG